MTRDPFHQRSGPRLPTGRPSTTPECFGCGEPGWIVARDKDLRRLTVVRVVGAGTTLGSTALCAPCVARLAPLDPDPLTVIDPRS